jgi:hypothetical protein
VLTRLAQKELEKEQGPVKEKVLGTVLEMVTVTEAA